MKILNRDHSPSFYQLNQDELKSVNGGGGSDYDPRDKTEKPVYELSEVELLGVSGGGDGGSVNVDPREKSASILKSWMKEGIDKKDE